MNFRVEFEQKRLPAIVYSDEQNLVNFIHSLFDPKEVPIRLLFQMPYDRENVKCPYDIDKIHVDSRVLSVKDDVPDFAVFTIDMPEPDEVGMAYRIFICLGKAYDYPAYFLAEKSSDDSYVICMINERGDHFSFMKVPEDRVDQLQAIAYLYGQYWSLKTNENTQVDKKSRYYIEQDYIPHVLFKNEHLGETLLRSLLEGDAKMMHTLFDSIYKTREEECPYSEEQFAVKVKEIPGEDNAPKFSVITIDLPKPEEMLLSSRIFICVKPSLEDLRYFLVEKSFDDEYALCGKDGEGAHLNFGKAPELEIEQFKKVCEIYNNYLKSLPGE